jgi:peptide deformylase
MVAKVTVRRVVRLGRPSLRRISDPVDQSDLKAGKYSQLIDDLTDTMRDYHGVGIAAPQVDVPVRLFVIEVNMDNERYPDRDGFALTVFANPDITLTGDRDQFSPEGCLSIPSFRGVARRHSAVEISALDRHGEPFEKKLQGLPAIIVQHEFDHLGGRLYIDRLWSPASIGYETETDRFGTLHREALDAVRLAD